MQKELCVCGVWVCIIAWIGYHSLTRKQQLFLRHRTLRAWIVLHCLLGEISGRSHGGISFGHFQILRIQFCLMLKLWTLIQWEFFSPFISDLPRARSLQQTEIQSFVFSPSPPYPLLFQVVFCSQGSRWGVGVGVAWIKGQGQSCHGSSALGSSVCGVPQSLLFFCVHWGPQHGGVHLWGSFEARSPLTGCTLPLSPSLASGWFSVGVITPLLKALLCKISLEMTYHLLPSLVTVFGPGDTPPSLLSPSQPQQAAAFPRQAAPPHHTLS